MHHHQDSSSLALLSLGAGVLPASLRQEPIRTRWSIRGLLWLTVIKCPLALLATFWAFSGAHLSLATLIVVVAILDILDGMFFERPPLNAFRRIRRARRILDGYSDRVFILATLLPLTLVGLVPVPLAIIFLVRECALGYVVALPYYRRGDVHAANNESRIATSIMAVITVSLLWGATAGWFLLPPFIAFAAAGLRRYVVSPRLLT